MNVTDPAAALGDLVAGRPRGLHTRTVTVLLDALGNEADTARRALGGRGDASGFGAGVLALLEGAA